MRMLSSTLFLIARCNLLHTQTNLFFIHSGSQKIVVFTGWSLGVGLQTVYRVKSTSLPGYRKIPLLNCSVVVLLSPSF